MVLRGRLLYKLGKEAALVRRRRRKEVKSEVREVIRSFLDDTGDGGQPEAAVLRSASGSTDSELNRLKDEQGQSLAVVTDGSSDEEFWANLPILGSRERHMLNVPTKPDRSYLGRAIKSRLKTFEAGGMAP